MSYIMCFLWRFKCLNIWHFLVIYCGSACIVFRESTRDLVPRTRFNTLRSSNPLSLMHWGHTTALHTLQLWFVGNDSHSRKIGLAIIIWWMCYGDFMSIVWCSGALRACVQIYLFVKYLTPKMDTHIKSCIIRTRTASWKYACNIYACYSTISNLKFENFARSFAIFFKNKQDRKTHVETHIKSVPKQFNNNKRLLKLKNLKYNLNTNMWLLQ